MKALHLHSRHTGDYETNQREHSSASPFLITVFHMSGFLDPVRQVPHKVEEEVAIRHTDDLENQKKLHV